MKRIALAIALLGILGAACGTAAAQNEPVTDAAGFPVEQVEPAPVVVDDTTELVADMVQDESIANGDWTVFCTGLDVLDYELAYSYFVDGYGSDDAEGRAIFDELASRC